MPATEFYVTDHSADTAITGSTKYLLDLYTDIERDGITSIRYDWRWSLIEPEPGRFSKDHLWRYTEAIELMDKAGLQAPTIILSSPPKWAAKLYMQDDKSDFFAAYERYVDEVVSYLTQSGGGLVTRVQIFNELNNRVYFALADEDLLQLCSITRRAFARYNPNVQLMATLLVGNVTRFTALPITLQYLQQFKAVATELDVIGIDYYPGLWHVGRNRAFKPSTAYKRMVAQIGPLQELFEELATWEQDYELAEIGIPSKRLWGGQAGQRYFYTAFFRAYAHMLKDFEGRGLKLPTRVGLYAAIDEAPTTTLQKILRRVTPFPEFDMGMRTYNGQQKLILQGCRRSYGHNEASQLRRIITFVNNR